jgi:hypothetical protein
VVFTSRCGRVVGGVELKEASGAMAAVAIEKDVAALLRMQLQSRFLCAFICHMLKSDDTLFFSAKFERKKYLRFVGNLYPVDFILITVVASHVSREAQSG